jgi:ADP-ribose pyrophosphatase
VQDGAWQPIAAESLLRVPPWLEVFRERLRLPDGREIDDFYTVRLPAYAVIVAISQDGRVVAERHYRPGARQVTWTLPSGFLEPEEGPLQGARRELREETGFASEDWTELGRFVVDGNRGCGTAHLFLARNAVKSSEPDGSDLAEVRIELVTMAEFLQAIRSGKALELASAAALGLAALQMQA